MTSSHASTTPALTALLFAFALLLAPVPVAGQTVIEKHEDSANAHDFTTVTDGVTNVTSDTLRWDAGYKVPSGETEGVRTDSTAALEQNGDWSLVFSFIPNGTGDRALFAVREVGGIPTNEEHFAWVTSDGELAWCWAEGSGCVESTTANLVNGQLYSAWIQFDQGGALTSSEARLKVFNATGVQLADDTATDPDDMSFDGEAADVTLSDLDVFGEIRIQGTEVYELRLWHTQVAAATLDAIAGAGGDTTWARELEGTEQAAWFMEAYLVGENAGRQADARVIAEATTTEINVTAWLENPEHEPANANRATVAIVTLDGTDPMWWNQTSQTFQAKATNVSMTEVAPWWHASITAPPAGDYIVVTWVKEDNQAVRASEQTTVTVPDTIAIQAVEIQSLDQNTLVYITGALIALVIAIWFGWLFSGIAAIFAVIDAILRAHTTAEVWSVEASIVLYTLAIIPHWVARRMEAERERRPHTPIEDLEQEGS